MSKFVDKPSLAALLAMTIAILGGCGNKAGTGAALSTGGNSGPTTITGMVVMYLSPPDPAGAFWRDMEAKYNIKYEVEWVQDSAYPDKLALVISTNSIPDVVQISDMNLPAFVKALENGGQFRDLTPHLDFNKYKNLGKISSAAWTNSKYKGKNYVFPKSRGPYNMCLFVRGDILKKYNLPKPASTAELTAYLEAFKKEPGTIPVSTSIQSYIDYFQGEFGPGNIVPAFTADGSGIVPFRLAESYALTLEWMNSLYRKGLVAQEFALFNEASTENALASGIGAMYAKNTWHRYRLEGELKKTLPNGELVPIYGFASQNGVNIFYDNGFWAGVAVNDKMSDAKFQKVMEFMDSTSDPANYNYFMFGLEGSYWTMVDGFPSLTELGKKEVTSSFFHPYTLATDLYNKVDSPLAPPAYNRAMRETAKELDVFLDKTMAFGQPFHFFSIITSKAWADFWALEQAEFNAHVVNVISGKESVAQFRTYQRQMLNRPEVQTAMKEYKQSWDESGLATWKPSAN